ncbi:type II toxin-antitoxin system HicB family antitoxin [bacterium]|nr:type II toxin-antitoxin system HicB family antitoxin [bacterium]
MARVLNLTAWVIREGEEFVSICPELDVSSCGSTAEEARRMLNEALEGFLEVASDEEIERRLANPVGFSEAITIQ